MTTGKINLTGQPTVSIIVLNPIRQQFIAFNPIVDTGFTGDLQLPLDDIARLDLTATEKNKDTIGRRTGGRSRRLFRDGALVGKPHHN